MSILELSDLGEDIAGLDLSVASKYTYEKLKHERSIRLLVLKPASSSHDRLQCELREVLLSDEPRYEAISYCWGEPVFPEELDLPTGSLKITKNLSLALRRFRLNDRVRHVWTDAVCINQDDNVERSKQVTLMGAIYRNAQRVLVWLGPGDELTSSVIRTLKQLAAQPDRYGIQRGPDQTILGNWPGTETPTGAVKKALENVSIEYDWSGADAFYSLPWFSRVWIVQEVALAASAHLYCGDSDILWDDLLLAAHVEYRSVQKTTAMNLRLPHGFHNLTFLANGLRLFRNKQVNSKLLSLISNFRTFECSDPRDRMYSMLALSGNRDVKVTPDYNKPVTKVYTEMTIEMLRKDLANSKWIFHYAGIARRFRPKGKKVLDYRNTIHKPDSILALQTASQITSTELPSWVPDWRITGDYDSFHLWGGIRFSSATRFRPNIQFSESDGTLSVVATIIDVIEAGKNLGSEPELRLNAHREKVLLMKQFFDQHVGKLGSRNDDEALTLFARTIIADFSQGTTRRYLQESLSTHDLKNLWLQFASTPFQAESSTEIFETDGSEASLIGEAKLQNNRVIKTYSRLYSYRLALLNLLNDRQFIITREGRAGLAPAIAQPGDLIVLFAGATVPLVLRPWGKDDAGKERYCIVGDCFLLGVMYGELFEKLENATWQWIALV